MKDNTEVRLKVHPKAAQPILFLHIPKAAGSTLSRFIEAQYPPWRIFSLSGYRPNESLKRFAALSQKRRDSFDVIKGHYAFGVHELLGKRARYLTVLREPVDRICSVYYYAKRNQRHPLHEIARSKGIAGFLEATKNVPALSNQQTRALSGTPQLNLAGSPQLDLDDRHLERAKKNLESFEGIGLSDRFQESLAYLTLVFDWTPLRLDAQNVTSNRPSAAQLTEATAEHIRQRNRLDVDLYAYAEQLYLNRIESHRTEVYRIMRLFTASENAKRLQPWILTARAAISRLASL